MSIVIMAVGGELHSDEEQVLLEQGPRQAHLWGINLYPEQYDTEDPKTQAIIVEIVGQLVRADG